MAANPSAKKGEEKLQLDFAVPQTGQNSSSAEVLLLYVACNINLQLSLLLVYCKMLPTGGTREMALDGAIAGSAPLKGQCPSSRRRLRL